MKVTKVALCVVLLYVLFVIPEAEGAGGPPGHQGPVTRQQQYPIGVRPGGHIRRPGLPPPQQKPVRMAASRTRHTRDGASGGLFAATSTIIIDTTDAAGEIITDTTRSATLTLTGANTYTGATVITAGTLVVSSGGTVADFLVKEGSGVLSLTGPATGGGLSGGSRKRRDSKRARNV